MSEQKYEDYMKVINQNLQKLESGNIDLEESVKIYTETMQASAEAEQILSKAENTINEFMKNG